MKAYLFGLVLISLQVSAGQIYQCGNLFQDRPCGGTAQNKVIGEFQSEKLSDEEIKAKRDEISMLEAQTDADIKARYDAEVAAAQRSQEASSIDRLKSEAIKSHRVVEGLSKQEVIKSWGTPNKKKQVNTEDGLREEWTFVRDMGNKEYIYFDGDTVSDVTLKETFVE